MYIYVYIYIYIYLIIDARVLIEYTRSPSRDALRRILFEEIPDSNSRYEQQRFTYSFSCIQFITLNVLKFQIWPDSTWPNPIIPDRNDF